MSYHRRKLIKIKYTTYFIVLILSHSVCNSKTYYNDTTKNKGEVFDNILGYSLEYVAVKLKNEFNVTTQEELGVEFIQRMYSKFKYTPVVQDVDKNLKKITDKLELKLQESFTVLNNTRELIEKYYYKGHDNSDFYSFVSPCNDVKSDLEEYDVLSGTINPNSYMEQTVNIKNVFKNQLSSFKNIKIAVKQYFFLSTYDVTNESEDTISKCSRQDQSLFWKIYMSQLKTEPRNVMLLLDHGGSLSKQQFRIVKTVAKQMISVLRDEDRIGLIALSEDWSSPYHTDQCLMPNQAPPMDDPYMIAPATQHNKNLLIHFINSLSKGNGATNHSLGFQQALQTIKMSNIPNNESVILLYISRGLLSSLTEPRSVLETIANNLNDIDNPVIINTCAVIDESKPVMYEMHFLRDIALQNYSKYNLQFKDTIKGLMLPVNSTQNVGLAVVRFYNTITRGNLRYNLKPMVYLPTWDDVSKDITVTATVPCGTDGEIGMLGIDIYFSNFAEDITYYSNYQQVTYAFMIDSQGITIMHPSYPRPTVITEQLSFVDIIHLEKVPDFKSVRSLLLSQNEGKYTIRSKTETVHYAWRKVLNWYTVCIVLHEIDVMPKRPYKVNWFPSSSDADLVHYRLDLLPTNRLCRHLNQISTLDAGSLYLSSSCFQSPFIYSRLSSLSPLNIQSYMAYLKDNTKLLANPGLREEIRDDVAAMAHILEYLRNQHLRGAKAKYIVRRYLTTPSGVLQLFPGASISPHLEPTKRNWYLRAIEHRFKTILTPPYLDAGGAGYIVTLAYATSHIVSAMDVTFGYIYRLMLEYMPFCNEPNVKCFMTDDRGYLIYHPNLIDPNGHGPIEQQHIIHKESLVANDILNHKGFVKKMLCNNYADGTIQRYYWLNTSLNQVLSNAVHGEHCVRYQLSAIESTNVFIGVVSASCELVATFCPCSMVDRLCLNCNRMEQKECECPCECPLNLNTCTHSNRINIENPLCSQSPEQSLSILSESDPNMTNELEPCLPISCETQLVHENCLGVLGCEWCKIDVDGETLLASPFCTSIQTCFNGVLGSPTPYQDSIGGSSTSEDLMGSSYSPVGPVIGSVFGVCLGLVLLFFCYRSYTSPSIERFYLTSAQENRIRMSDVNVSDEYRELDNHQDKLLQDTKKLEPVSPYCVSTGYCRPVTAADSDHGYSTMTPHDESEHLSFAPLEIDSLEDDCTSDATSINTSVSSRQAQAKTVRNKGLTLPVNLQTSLPSRNCIIAPVTVHRNMEMTQ